MAEKRKFHRWPCSLKCSCKSETIEFTGTIVGLSFDGACIAEPSAIPPEGSDLIVYVQTPEESVSIGAHVVYQTEGMDQIGLQFYGPVEERSQKLLPLFKRYVDSET